MYQRSAVLSTTSGPYNFILQHQNQATKAFRKNFHRDAASFYLRGSNWRTRLFFSQDGDGLRALSQSLCSYLENRLTWSQKMSQVAARQFSQFRIQPGLRPHYVLTIQPLQGLTLHKKKRTNRIPRPTRDFGHKRLSTGRFPHRVHLPQMRDSIHHDPINQSNKPLAIRIQVIFHFVKSTKAQPF